MTYLATGSSFINCPSSFSFFLSFISSFTPSLLSFPSFHFVAFLFVACVRFLFPSLCRVFIFLVLSFLPSFSSSSLSPFFSFRFPFFFHLLHFAWYILTSPLYFMVNFFLFFFFFTPSFLPLFFRLRFLSYILSITSFFSYHAKHSSFSHIFFLHAFPNFFSFTSFILSLFLRVTFLITSFINLHISFSPLFSF